MRYRTLLAAVVLLFAACSQTEPVPVAEPVAALAPTSTPAPPPTSTVEPTATPVPTATAEPTATVEPTPDPALERERLVRAYQAERNELLASGVTTAYWQFAAEHTWPPGGFDGSLLQCLVNQGQQTTQIPSDYNFGSLTPAAWSAPNRGSHPGTNNTPDGQTYQIGRSIGPLYAEGPIYFEGGQVWTFFLSDANAANCA